MKTLSIALIGLLGVSSVAEGQEPLSPMRLLPVEIEEVEVEDTSDVAPQPAPDAAELPSPGNLDTPAERFAAEESVPQRRREITQEQLAELQKPLSQLHLSGLSESINVSQVRFTGEPVRWITASELGHPSSFDTITTYTRRRLYFEDSALERCGKTDCLLSNGILTNLHSGTKFLVDTALLPYRLIRERPDELVRAIAE